MALFRRFRPRYQFPLIRIDDRLIHGQVVLGWVEPLRIRSLVLAHDKVAVDDDLKDAIAQTVPSQIDFSVQTISETVSVVQRVKESTRLMVVAESPADVISMWEQGAAFTSITIGGLHFHNGRSQLLTYVYMSPGEIDLIDQMSNAGVEVICQDLPSSVPVPCALI